MKTPPNNLKDAFESLLNLTLAAELKYSKLFEQFSTFVETAELAAVLSPARNEFEQHIERLGRLCKHYKLRPVRECLEVDEVFLATGKEVCGYKKQLSKFKDSQILSTSKQITYHRIAIYSTLEAMATALDADEPGLLKQTSAELRNTGAYFCQIEQNILYPGLAK